MIVDAVREYMLTCPLLSGKKININCLGTKPGSLSLDNVKVDPVIRKYCDGSMLKQAVFDFGVRGRYDEIMGENLDISTFLEEIEAWICKQNLLKILPEFASDNLIAKGIEVTKSGYLHDTSMGSGRWQMEFRIIYRQNEYVQIGT